MTDTHMFLGIDVGGTHTDAVVLEGRKVLARAKVATDHANLLASVRGALDAVLGESGVSPERIARLNLSTTLCTNAIVEGRTEEVGVFVSAGPGIDPENVRIGGHYYVLPGSIDHRGKEISPLDSRGLRDALTACREAGVRVYAAVSKFSVRNPVHEQSIYNSLTPQADYVSLGHRLSGSLNFPRRVGTAYYNAAVWRTYNEFATAVEASIREAGLEHAAVNVLKADGGTMPLPISRTRPVESILSGPAASVMGIIALCDIARQGDDCAILDIGGTTTDIAVFASGAPVIEPHGIDVGSYPTLVRALRTHSIGIGGDSHLHLQAGAVRVGPERKGHAMANGGRHPALIDALNHLGLAQVGDVAASRRGIEKLAGLWDMFPDKVAQAAVDTAVAAIRDAVRDILWAINEKPVYTLFELLSGKRIEPARFYCMGGPAGVFQPLLKKALDREVVVPEDFAVANAIGAALTRTTVDAELFADTEKGVLFMPSIGVQGEVDKHYDLERATADAKRHLAAYLRQMAGEAHAVAEPDIDVTESGSFNMVGNYGTAGRNIRVRCQIRPGIDE